VQGQVSGEDVALQCFCYRSETVESGGQYGFGVLSWWSSPNLLIGFEEVTVSAVL